MSQVQLGRPRPPDLSPAERVLVDHQRISVGACGCGWNEYGKSFARHQVKMLAEAGLLVEGAW